MPKENEITDHQLTDLDLFEELEVAGVLKEYPSLVEHLAEMREKEARRERKQQVRSDLAEAIDERERQKDVEAFQRDGMLPQERKPTALVRDYFENTGRYSPLNPRR